MQGPWEARLTFSEDAKLKDARHNLRMQGYPRENCSSLLCGLTVARISCRPNGRETQHRVAVALALLGWGTIASAIFTVAFLALTTVSLAFGTACKSCGSSGTSFKSTFTSLARLTTLAASLLTTTGTSSDSWKTSNLTPLLQVRVWEVNRFRK